MLADLRTYLLTITAVNALSGEKVYVYPAAQGATGPHVVIHRLREDPHNHLGGRGGFHSAEIEIDCKAPTPDAAGLLASAIVAALEPHTGAMGTKTLSAAIHEDTHDWAEAARPGSAVDQYVTTLDFTLQYR